MYPAPAAKMKALNFGQKLQQKLQRKNESKDDTINVQFLLGLLNHSAR